jgi:hypothetical protein
MKQYLPLIITVCVAFFLGSCVTAKAVNKEQIHFNKTAFENNWNAWKNARISDYRFVQDFDDDELAGPAVLITVIQNKEFTTEVLQKEILDAMDEELASKLAKHYLADTIDDLYKKLSERITKDENRIKNGEDILLYVDIYYDEEYHFPNYIRYGIASNSANDGKEPIFFDNFKLIIYDFVKE